MGAHLQNTTALRAKTVSRLGLTAAQAALAWKLGKKRKKQGGDWFGSTLVGRIFLVRFGLASLVDIWQNKNAEFTLKTGKLE